MAPGNADAYLEYLREEGYSPRADDDGDVVFKFEGSTYLLVCDEEDEIFFRLMRPGFWEIETSEEEDRALKAVNQVNAMMKVVKLAVMRDCVWASVELYIDPFESFKRIFRRSLRLLAQSVREFGDAMLGGA